MTRPIIIGITGSIASGKSELVQILLRQGLQVHSTDQLGHKALEDKEVITSLTERFGNEILNNRGQIDRAKLSTFVFQDKNRLHFLNSVSHPQIFKLMRQLIQTCSDKYIFFEVPLLFEANLQDYFDYILTVSLSEDKQIERLMKRNDLNREEALNKISSQLSNKIKEEKADYVIFNDGSLNDLLYETKKWLKQLPTEKLKFLKEF